MIYIYIYIYMQNIKISTGLVLFEKSAIKEEINFLAHEEIKLLQTMLICTRRKIVFNNKSRLFQCPYR